MRIHHLIFSTLTVLALNACGDDEMPEPMQGSEDDAGDMPYEGEVCPDDLPEMRIGMEAMGASQLIRGELIDADKIPVGWYHNDWVVQFTGPEGEPLEDIELERAYTFMRVHGHDGGQEPTIEDLGGGEFAFDGLNVTMTGPWEFTFKVKATTEGGESVTDEVIFYVCNSQRKPASP